MGRLPRKFDERTPSQADAVGEFCQPLPNNGVARQIGGSTITHESASGDL
jgi:hypothetical protein